MKSVSGLSGVKSLLVDRKYQKITVTGDMDPVKVVNKLKKFCYVELDFVGPAKEENKGEKEQLSGLVNQSGTSCPCSCSCPCPCPYPYPCYYYKIIEDHPSGCVIC
ncbi:putative heavy metal-associated domain, HMA [Lupinus albus]|uniref:Putative heavy metal-associated domain, HMA n=1 Tax=Lupinus albus TaxID=3870 RepID=A0A6A4QRJ9_LUPAL|nr:putative heavy metal-associated domain, HMA [Lupinus albus]